VPSWEIRDLRQLLWHRHRMVQARTQITNRLQAVALNEGLRCKKRLWRKHGRQQAESFRHGSVGRGFSGSPFETEFPASLMIYQNIGANPTRNPFRSLHSAHSLIGSEPVVPVRKAVWAAGGRHRKTCVPTCVKQLVFRPWN
jgi:hypothetical protein